MKNAKFIIREVDCYIGNAHYFSGHETDKSVQHQLLLIEDEKEIVVSGTVFAPSDSDRYSRTVLEVEPTKELYSMWKKAKSISMKQKHENCETKEQSDALCEHNKEFVDEANNILKRFFHKFPFKETVSLNEFMYSAGLL